MIPICPNCKSKQVLFRVKTNTLYCRRCGHSWVKKDTKGQQKEGHK